MQQMFSRRVVVYDVNSVIFNEYGTALVVFPVFLIVNVYCYNST